MVSYRKKIIEKEQQLADKKDKDEKPIREKLFSFFTEKE